MSPAIIKAAPARKSVARTSAPGQTLYAFDNCYSVIYCYACAHLTNLVYVFEAGLKIFSMIILVPSAVVKSTVAGC